MCVQQITLDIEELNKLVCITTRPRIKDMLVKEILRLQSQNSTEISEASTTCDNTPSGSSRTTRPESSETALGDAVNDKSTATSEAARGAIKNPCISTSKSTPQRYYKELTTYGKTPATSNPVTLKILCTAIVQQLDHQVVS